MKFIPYDPPREFEVGFFEKKVTMRDCGRIELAADELVTFLTPDGKEYDLARKSWGYYATPSLAERLRSFRMRACLAKNHLDKYCILFVEEGREADFDKYLREEHMQVVAWLDTKESLQRIEKAVIAYNGS